jgi:hypothetical protein
MAIRPSPRATVWVVPAAGGGDGEVSGAIVADADGLGVVEAVAAGTVALGVGEALGLAAVPRQAVSPSSRARSPATVLGRIGQFGW